MVDHYPTPQEILSDLKYIASFKAGDKIDVYKYQTTPKGNILQNVFTSLHRSYSGVSRNDTYSFIQSVQKTALTMLESSMYKKEYDLARMFIKDLNMARTGVEAQKETYADDQKLVADFDTLLQTIYLQVGQIEAELKSINADLLH